MRRQKGQHAGQKRSGCFVNIDPTSTRKQMWDLYMFGCLTVISLVTPFEVAYLECGSSSFCDNSYGGIPGPRERESE